MIRFLLLLILSTSTLYAQRSDSTITKLQAFKAIKKNIVLIESYRIGAIPNKAVFQVQSALNLGTNEKVYGIQLELKDGYKTTGYASIDYEEIENIIKSLDYLHGIDKLTPRLGNVSGFYSTASGFKLGILQNGERLLTLFAGEGMTVFKIDQFNEVRQLFVDAKSKIDSVMRQ
ncbi:hypothetical protein A6C57_23390 [Fibrella sp. ES10-3-2-2]|nr:hypothetical protein A6C57_23390 [Fibrella sp. ES10-3-2-2]